NVLTSHPLLVSHVRRLRFYRNQLYLLHKLQPLLLFFVYFFDSHRDLHSFPTRRSSDLSSGANASLGGRGTMVWPRATLSQANSRSEEHTSELQSRFDLVCRLLLEKKKMMKEKIYNASIDRYGISNTIILNQMYQLHKPH